MRSATTATMSTALEIVNAASPTPGIFIALEGPDGIGKTTLAARLRPSLTNLTGREVVPVREPGSTALGLQLRQLLLDARSEPMSGETELLLFSAARRHLLDRVVAPAVAAGGIVLTDRFALSTYAYQGYGRGVALDAIDEVTRVAVGANGPAVTIVLTMPLEAWRARLAYAGRVHDAFESDVALLECAQANYLTAAARIPNAIAVSAEGDEAAVEARVLAALRPVLEARALVAPVIASAVAGRSATVSRVRR
jgi:dTMP kinase